MAFLDSHIAEEERFSCFAFVFLLDFVCALLYREISQKRVDISTYCCHRPFVLCDCIVPGPDVIKLFNAQLN